METTLLKDIVIIFGLSVFVNMVFTKLKIPTIVGYLLTGIIAGPHVLSIVGSRHEIELLAEIGVILLLFTIGMEFSLKHLLKIRRIVFLGGLMQVSITAGAIFLISLLYDTNKLEGIFIGFLIALSSSALVLKILQERSELSSNYGRTVLGILIFQDILLVPLLLFTDLLGEGNINLKTELFFMALKVVGIIGLVYIGNKWLIPKIMHKIAMTKNQELFLMSILFICFATALMTYKLGMSLAFGAFLAGLIISESEYSHNAFANLIPFKDTFLSFFFISVGMLLEITFVINYYQTVLISVFLVIIIKAIIAGATGFTLGHTFKGTVVVGLALAQVGEFSFILAKIGLDKSVLSTHYYQLFLAVSVITMGLTPFIMSISAPLARILSKLPLPKFLINGLFPLKEMEVPDLSNHLVIIGKDTSALKLSAMARINNISHISIIFDPHIVKERIQKGDTVVYGDAAKESILKKSHVDTADIVVVSVGDLIPAMTIVEKVRHINRKIYIIVRVKSIENVPLFYKLGADQVLPEKLEIAMDLFNRILIQRLYPRREVNRILTHIRSINLGEFREKDILNQPTLFDQLPSVSINAFKIDKNSYADEKTLLDIDLRKKTGVTLLAIKRGKIIIEHPSPEIKFEKNDIVYLLGNPEQINFASELFIINN